MLSSRAAHETFRLFIFRLLISPLSCLTSHPVSSPMWRWVPIRSQIRSQKGKPEMFFLVLRVGRGKKMKECNLFQPRKYVIIVILIMVYKQYQ